MYKLVWELNVNMEVPKAVPATECYVCNEHWAPRLSSMEHQQLKLLLLRGYLPIWSWKPHFSWRCFTFAGLLWVRSQGKCWTAGSEVYDQRSSYNGWGKRNPEMVFCCFCFFAEACWDRSRKIPAKCRGLEAKPMKHSNNCWTIVLWEIDFSTNAEVLQVHILSRTGQDWRQLTVGLL